jgi:ABC-type transport system substrate-binding protein
MALLLVWSADAFAGGQPPSPAKEGDAWSGIRQQIQAPADFVVREEASAFERPLPLTQEEVRDPANGIIRVDRFETRLMELIDKASAASPDRVAESESVLAELLRAHHSWRTSKPGSDPWRKLRVPIEQRLDEVRAKRIQRADARQRSALLDSAHVWLRSHGHSSEVATAIKQWWIDEAQRAIDEKNGVLARQWRERIVTEFGASEQTEPIEAKLREMADRLVKQASEENTASAARLREEARTVWPESVAHLKPLDSSKTLTVSSRTLPKRFSPGGAQTDDEHRCAGLLFSSLDRVTAKKQWNAADLLWKDRLSAHAKWADGSLVSADDVRHTLRLLEASPGWRLPVREWIQSSSSPHRDEVVIQLRQASFPWRDLFSVPVVPRLVGNQELSAWDDPRFATTPKTLGRYRLSLPNAKGAPSTIVLDADPWAERRPFFERIEWSPRQTSGIAEIKPDVALDLSVEEAKAAKKAGYSVRSTISQRCWYLAPNHRRPLFANADLRRGVAFAVDRSSILKSIVLADEENAKTASGPFPPGSWALASPPQVPASLDQPEAAIAHLRKANAEKDAKIAVIFSVDAPDADAACKAIVSQLNAACSKAEARIVFEAKGLSAETLHSTIERREFDIALVPLDLGADLWSLWSLFDRDAAALDAKGSNLSGFSDAKLESLFRVALLSRRFSALRDATANIHAYLVETMPIIPLWQIPTRVAIAPNVDAPPADGINPFKNIELWKRKN